MFTSAHNKDGPERNRRKGGKREALNNFARLLKSSISGNFSFLCIHV